MPSPALSREELDRLIQQVSASEGVDPGLVTAIVEQESNYNPRAVSTKGALGLMQLLPSTAEGLGEPSAQALFDPETNLRLGTQYFKSLLQKTGGDIPTALTMYHSGPGNVAAGNIGPIGEVYAPQVLGRYARISGGGNLPTLGPQLASPEDPLLSLLNAQSSARAAQFQAIGEAAVAQPAPELSGFRALVAEPQTPDESKTNTLESLIYADPARAAIGAGMSWGDVIGDLVIDQLEPVNLALLVASFPVGGFAYKAAAKAVGAPIVKGLFGRAAARVAPNALTTAGSVVGRTLVPRAVEGLAFSTTFSAAELFEEPPEGASRMGEFFRALAFNEVFDAGLMAVGIPFARIGRAQREALQTFQLSRSKGATSSRAAADAIISKVELLKADGVPQDLINGILRSSAGAVSEETVTLLNRLRFEHESAISRRAAQLGFSPEQVQIGFMQMVDNLIIDNEVAAAQRATTAPWIPKSTAGGPIRSPLEALQRDYEARRKKEIEETYVGVKTLDEYLARTSQAHHARVAADYITIETADLKYPWPPAVTAAIAELSRMGVATQDELRAHRLNFVQKATRTRRREAEKAGGVVKLRATLDAIFGKAEAKKAKKVTERKSRIEAKMAELDRLIKERQKRQPEWLQQNMEELYREGVRAGAVTPIEELAAKRLTAKQIAKQLNLDTNVVIAVRTKLGIPSMEQKSDFEHWLKSRTRSAKPEAITELERLLRERGIR